MIAEQTDCSGRRFAPPLNRGVLYGRARLCYLDIMLYAYSLFEPDMNENNK